MCEYCGCQSVDAIAQLTREHDELRSVAREATEAARAADHADAARAAGRLLTLLSPHTEIEERGLFPASLSVFTPTDWDALDDVRAQVLARAPTTVP